MSGSPERERILRAPGGRETQPAARFLLALLCFVLLLCAVSPAEARREYFTIRSFRTAIEVHSDSSLRVVETIEAEFHSSRHGIYRDIPFRYVDELGRSSVTPLDVLSVTDGSGNRWNYRVRRSGSIVRIRIGDPKRYVRGRQTYVISYRVENGLLSFPDHDELYWNATGNGWPVPIDAATAVVTFATDRPPGSLRNACYTGPRGSREKACEATTDSRGAVFRATRGFGPREGMTIVLGWDKGIVHPPSAWKMLLYRLNLHENWPVVLPPLTFLFMLRLWYRKGRDPRTGHPLVVAYTPPEEGGRPLLPAEAGTLIDERFDPRDLTASVVDLAVRGYLSIGEATSGFLRLKDDYRLRREREPDENLPPFGRILLEKLFEERRAEVLVSDLTLKFYRHIDDLKKVVFEDLLKQGYFAGHPETVTFRYVRAGSLLVGFGILSGVILQKLWGSESFLFPVSVSISGAVVLLFARFMPVKTRKGVLALEKVRGFEEFLMRAEKDRLERMNDPRLFEKYLPYAIALGVSERWAKAFEGIAQEPPRWYVSRSGFDTFRPSAFHRSLDAALSDMASSMTAAPRSSGSGFSGGGGSGGGGGGGGGGSW
ncbi:MAG: DUF2207 domain-containing protein [Deltaproteobacteria bacterium]